MFARFFRILLYLICPGWKNNGASLGIMGDHFRAPWKPSVHHGSIVLGGLGGALNRASIMSRDAHLSDSKWKFFQSGYLLGIVWINYHK